ncbi:S8 family serine peptidase [Actinoplanes sp. CA-030573]|uniref:S8 family serine peptidase n=1 Tax=Actinoplanes sp. CA-030573 TaxID=3239898 RepID=UPI003D8DFCD4
MRRSAAVSITAAGMCLSFALPLADPWSSAYASNGTTCLQAKNAAPAGEPWAERRVAAERAWPASTGRGVTVAVLATGVDARNPAFAPGQVLTGADVRSGNASGAGNRDCDGRGTFAAGLVAAQPTTGSAFAGVAPDATILPIRYAGALNNGSDQATPNALARAIRYATKHRADVILIPLAQPKNTQDLRDAVAAAVAADEVVVSAGAKPEAGITYPTGYPGVLAVTAVDQAGKVMADADQGPHIDVAAPGTGLVGPVGDGGYSGPVDSPGMAAAFVAGTAALVRARLPNLSAAGVIARLEATADLLVPDPNSAHRLGVVNAYSAVTAAGDALGEAARVNTVDGDPAFPAIRRTTDGLAHRRHRAELIASVAFVLASAIGVGFLLIRRMRSESGAAAPPLL